MGIRVRDGHVWMTAEPPVFIGTTGSGSFPEPGTPMREFHFIPTKDTSGTLVFDRAREKTRTQSTASFCQYWHDDGKLVVMTGLRDGSLKPHTRNVEAGFHFLVESPYTVYFTGQYTHNVRAYKLCKVGIVDMLKCLEGKISLDQLNERVIKE